MGGIPCSPRGSPRVRPGYRLAVAYADALTEQTDLLGELVRPADMATPVPTCPGWTLRQLITHVGRGHRWAATIVRERAGAYVDVGTVPDGRPPADLDGALGWLRDGAQAVVDAVATTGAQTPVWTFIGARPAEWWIRRRLHEATVHRADAAIARGVPYELAPELAADGVSELLDLHAARPAESGAAPLADGATMHLHATDDGLGTAGEWIIRGTGAGVGWEHGHGKGDAAVRGAATDLLLGVYRRLDADDVRLDVLGDESTWTTWLERTAF